MPDNSTTPTPVNTPADNKPAEQPEVAGDMRSKVSHEIAESQNVLVALSSDPSVDEMAAAIGLSLYLDRMGKRATAIYSGSTPNALEFLKPEDTFEPTADTLQDFVVALNKEKADHVRCKVDGDYVKLYITPYRAKVSEEDLEFSYGDYNVDLVLALDVANGIDLDSALREHGRIMHDASVVNITTGNPGRFGEIEWNDKAASSVSEMIADLIFTSNAKEKLSPEEATAFLTGIVAATDRFSSASTTSRTMKVASKLMEAGANQQLISQNITDDIENEIFNLSPIAKAEIKKDDATNIEIEHSKDTKSEAGTSEAEPSEAKDSSEVKDASYNKDSSGAGESESFVSKAPALEPIAMDSAKEESPSASEGTGEGMSQESSLLADLQQAAASLAQAGDETVPAPGSEPIKIDSAKSDLSSVNPASMNAPEVPSAPEINGVPEINYAPSSGAPVLPPPPAPPIDENVFTPSDVTEPSSGLANGVSGADTPAAGPSLGSQPAMQDQVYNPQAADPGAFKIPGL